MPTFGSAVERLRTQFKGVLLTQADAGYDDARPIWNAMWNHCRPLLIARCVGPADVRAAILFARELALPTAVRGGGHSMSGKGTCDGGLVIDLSMLKGVHVNARSRTAVAGGGCLWEDYDRETQAFGLATPGGVVSHTGIGGFALGGGIGWLGRRFGLTCDNLVSADLVTAEGEFVHASAAENPELFWALRGGGGNFGVVTHFTFKLHKVGPSVICGILMWPIERATEAWDAYAEIADSAPDELGCTLGMMRAPAAPFVEESLHGKLVAGFFFCWTGAAERAESVVAPFLERRPPVRCIGPLPYVSLQKMVDFLSPHGRRSYCKAGYTKALSAPFAAATVENIGRSVSPFSQAEFVLLGGAMARVPEEATAFGDRSGRLLYNVVVNWTDRAEDAANRDWATTFFEALQPFSTSTVYVNFLGDEGGDRIRAAYGEKYERLAQIKRRYDPENFFNSNQNIVPAAGGPRERSIHE
jgi:FAD/FMN-containing dehydrogenase